MGSRQTTTRPGRATHTRARPARTRATRAGAVPWRWLVLGSLVAVVAIATLKTGDYHALAFGPDDPDVVFFGHHNGILRSDDGGRTWTPAANGLDSRSVQALAVDPAARGTVFAGVEGGLYKSADGGASWSRLPFPGANVVALAVSPSRPNRMLVIAVKNGQGLVYRSDDGGSSWGERE